jgi:lipoprotein-releasing system ATP-binding protein
VSDSEKLESIEIRHGDEHDHSGPLLVVEGLGKVYGDGVPFRALGDVSFELDRGTFASIVGQSGSGKSTLLNQIGLLDTPTEGKVLIDNKDTRAIGRKGRAILRNELIGFVFQFHYLLPEFSVIENVLMPSLIERGSPTPELRDQALETLGYMGLAEEADKNANDLSGGQKQRVAIARALMNRPELLLADEPTGNLDTVNTKSVYELFRRINRDWGTTFLIVTHDRGIAEQTDRILEIQDGHLIQDVATEYARRKTAEHGTAPASNAAPPRDAAAPEAVTEV